MDTMGASVIYTKNLIAWGQAVPYEDLFQHPAMLQSMGVRSASSKVAKLPWPFLFVW